MSKQHVSRFASIGYSPKRLAGLRSRKLVNSQLGKFRAANRGRRLNPDECRAVENQLREQGKLQP
jgi:hypothetical protein